MATRTISTKLAITGEADYRAALKRCNTELRTLRSELGYTEEKYRTNANTLEALENKVKALTDVYQKQSEKVGTLEKALGSARDAYAKYSNKADEARENIERCQKALDDLQNTTGDTSEEQRELNEELRKWKTALQDAEEYQEAAKRGVENWTTQLNGAKTEQLRLNEELEKNKRYLDEARTSTDQCADSIDEYGNEVKGAGEKSEDFGERSKDAIDKLAAALAAAGVAKTVKEIGELLRDCADAAVEFESAMAGVSKTTDLSDEELAEMSDAIKEMATRIPATTTEIAGVVEAAGQLGIAKEDLLDFAEVMVNLGTATNLSSDEAASSLAKFANVVKMDPENYGRLGSTIVDLGNNFATTEADIVSMATRLASTGEIVGLSEPQIMAVATALSSVGIEAEAGGSAISKLLKRMETSVQTYGNAKATVDETGYSVRELELMASNDSAAFKGLAGEMGLTTTELKNYMSTVSDLESYADVSGQSAEDFVKAWGEDAVGALGDFITGLGKVDEAGGSSVTVLQDMGITEVRLSNAVQSLASSQGILERALDTANGAWEDNNALAKEAATRYETTESKLQLTKNAAGNLKIAIGEELLPVIGNLADAGTTALTWASDFVEDNPWVVGVITGLGTALGVVATGVAGLAAAPAIIEALSTAFGLLAAHPFVLVAAGVAGLAAAIATIAANSEDADPKLEEFTQAARNMDDAIASAKTDYEDTALEIEATANMADMYISKLEEMGDYSQLNNEQQEEYRGILQRLTELVPELSGLIDVENGYIEGGTEALRANTEAWEKNAKAQAYQEALNKVHQAYADVLLEAEKNQIRYNEAKKKAAEYDEKIEAAERRMLEIREMAQKLSDEANKDRGGIAPTSYYDFLTPEYLGEMADEYWNLADSIGEWSRASDAAAGEAETLEQAMESNKDAVAEAQAVIDETTQAVENLTGATGEGTEALEENTGAVEENTGALEENAQAAGETAEASDELIETIAALEEQYNATAESARDSIQRQIDYFGELDEQGETTIQNIIDNMLQQAQAMEKYADNITLAMERGVDQGMIEKLSDGSEESAKILATIVSGTEDEIDKLNAAFAKVEEGTTAFGEAVAEAEKQNAIAMAGIKEEYEATLKAVDGYNAFYESGQNSVQGYIDGAQSMETTLTGNMRRLAEQGHKSFQMALDINSPSKKFAESGHYSIEGVIVGAEEKERELEETYSRLAQKAIQAYDDAAPSPEKLPGADQAPALQADQMAWDVQMILRAVRGLSADAGKNGLSGEKGTGGAGGIDPDILAKAVSKALVGVGIFMDKRKVGEFVDTYQKNRLKAVGG